MGRKNYGEKEKLLIFTRYFGGNNTKQFCRDARAEGGASETTHFSMSAAVDVVNVSPLEPKEPLVVAVAFSPFIAQRN